MRSSRRRRRVGPVVRRTRARRWDKPPVKVRPRPATPAERALGERPLDVALRDLPDGPDLRALIAQLAPCRPDRVERFFDVQGVALLSRMAWLRIAAVMQRRRRLRIAAGLEEFVTLDESQRDEPLD